MYRRRRSSQWKYDKATEMRNNPTNAEARMYEILYQDVVPKYPQNIFYRQSVKYGYILDFYCPNLRLAIEVDGSLHESQLDYDRHRDAVLAQKNISVYRFYNDEVLYNPQGVTTQLYNIIGEIERSRSVQSSSHCFIATAAYGTTTAKELDVLRNFRDVKLKSNPIGRRMTDLYYSVSPPIANIIVRSEGMRAFVRQCLNPIIKFLKRKGY